MPGNIRSWVILIFAAAVLQSLTASAFKMNSINCIQRRGTNRQEGILQCQYAPVQYLYTFSYWERQPESEDGWTRICQCLPDNHCSMLGSKDNFLCEADPGYITLYIHNITKQDQRLYKCEVTWENLVMQKEINFNVNDESAVEQSRTTYPVTEKPQNASTEQSRAHGGSSEIRAREVELPVIVLLFILIGLIMVLLVAVITCYVKKRNNTDGEEMKPETEPLHMENGEMQQFIQLCPSPLCHCCQDCPDWPTFSRNVFIGKTIY